MLVTRFPASATSTVAHRQFFSLNETHTFGPNLLNEARLGFNRLSSTNTPNAQLNPADFGIRNGISAAHRAAADQHCRRRSELRRARRPSHRAVAIRPSSLADTLSWLVRATFAQDRR